jgi:Tfp pilus assembly protein PilP
MMWNEKDIARATLGVPVGLGVLVVAVMLLSAGWGCTPDIQEPPPRPDRDSDQEMTEEIGEIRGFEEADDYSRPDYAVRRNPFRPDPEALGVNDREETEEDTGPTSPTEEYALSSLQLVTIMSETAVPKAMFIDPTGLGHFLKEGDRIGRRGGVIRNIRSNEVEIRAGAGGAANMVTVRLRDHDPARQAGERLTEEEREALRRLLESEDGQEVLEEMGSADRPEGSSPPQDERFPGLRPPR